ncbi:MAG TPA: GNAT family N-acetyltransferase [Acidobacteriaceae bacterium]|jgi:ribosomal protein S18 acetylase RimI-like enzyme|nr:GNAT family N-acetyltransferase [Acidobacteriaceae bacterium]
MPEITIEPATLNDLPALCRLRAEYQGHPLEWEPRIAAYMIGQLTPAFGLEPRAVFVAVQDNEVVGFIAGHLSRRFNCQGEIYWLNVQADRRGLRIADRLLAALVAWFAGHNARSLCIEVPPSNDSARKLLARHNAHPHDALWLTLSPAAGDPAAV